MLMTALRDALSFVQTAIEEQTEKVAGMLKDERGEKKMSRLSEIFYCMYIGGNPDVEGLESVGRWDGNITLERMEDDLHKLLAEDAYEAVMDFASEIQEHFFRKGFETSLMLQREGRG